MSFSEVRDYQFGDDVRNIDWNVTARSGTPHIKIFEEERELTVMMLVDRSGSSSFGTKQAIRQEIITEICAVLAFSAIQNNDKVGILFFSDQVEQFIPPKKGKQHILRIIRELVDMKPAGKKTDLSQALEYFNNVQKKRSICFVLSDFITEDYLSALRIAARRHDLIGIHLCDPVEADLPNVGLVRMIDAETGQIQLVDTSSKQVRNQQQTWFEQQNQAFLQAFRRSGAGVVSIRSDESYVNALLRFFKNRTR